MTRYFLILLALALALPAFAIDYLGTSVQMTWDDSPADESAPEGWRVYVSRNGGDFALDQTVTSRPATITGAAEETIAIKVSAFLGDFETDQSVASDPITFRVLSAPTGVMIRCPDGQTFTEGEGGWWSCQ